MLYLCPFSVYYYSIAEGTQLMRYRKNGFHERAQYCLVQCFHNRNQGSVSLHRLNILWKPQIYLSVTLHRLNILWQVASLANFQCNFVTFHSMCTKLQKPQTFLWLTFRVLYGDNTRVCPWAAVRSKASNPGMPLSVAPFDSTYLAHWKVLTFWNFMYKMPQRYWSQRTTQSGSIEDVNEVNRLSVIFMNNY